MQTDRFGRSNILLVGTSEDYEDNHAPLLTDTLIVFSIDPEQKTGNTLSIHRDLWVPYAEECNGSSEGRINAIYRCGLDDRMREIRAVESVGKKVEQIIDTDIQYVVKLDWTALRELVDYLGGISVTIDNSDSRGIYDVGTGLKLPNGINQIDDDRAIDLVRARGMQGGYGFDDYVYTRQEHQEEVVRAIQREAAGVDFLKDRTALLRLTESLRGHLSSNIPANEVEAFIEMLRGFDVDDVKSINLHDPDDMLLQSAEINGQSVVVPEDGIGEYSRIQTLFQEAVQ